jgi:hypothetical protein
MRYFMNSFPILLALVAFSPTTTTAKGPEGVQGKGHPGGGQQSVRHQSGTPQSVGHQSVGQPTIERQGTGSSGNHYEAGPSLGRARDAGTNAYRGEGAHVNPQFSVGVGVAAGAESWRYRSDNGRWWYWTPQNSWMRYGDDGQWTDYRADSYPAAANAYAVERPILENSLPAANFSGGPITITNPATNNVALSYTLDGVAYTIAPGYTQDFSEDRAWVIQFSRGANLDQVQYGLQSGLYSFTSTDQGWELYRSELP